ncbi:N-glycosidase, partial [Penicillium sp. IBT 35674x]
EYTSIFLEIRRREWSPSDNGTHRPLFGHKELRLSVLTSNTSITSTRLHMRHLFDNKSILFSPALRSNPSNNQKKIHQGWKIHPRILRNLGRQIPDFVHCAWEAERYAIVLEGSYLKSSQNENLEQILLATGDRELVEASPRDRFWGIGFGKDAAGMHRVEWGLNFLGKALMEVRARLREEDGT